MLTFHSFRGFSWRSPSRVGWVGLLLMAGGAFAACSESPSATGEPVKPRPPVGVVLISPTTSTLKVGQSQQFVASVPSGAATQFAWRAGDTSLVSISSAGVATARKAGNTTISALIVSDTALRGTITLNIVP